MAPTQQTLKTMTLPSDRPNNSPDQQKRGRWVKRASAQSPARRGVLLSFPLFARIRGWCVTVAAVVYVLIARWVILTHGWFSAHLAIVAELIDFCIYLASLPLSWLEAKDEEWLGGALFDFVRDVQDAVDPKACPPKETPVQPLMENSPRVSNGSTSQGSPSPRAAAAAVAEAQEEEEEEVVKRPVQSALRRDIAAHHDAAIISRQQETAVPKRDELSTAARSPPRQRAEPAPHNTSPARRASVARAEAVEPVKEKETEKEKEKDASTKSISSEVFNAIPIEPPPQVDLDAELRAQRAQLRRVLRPGESPATLHDRAGHSFGPHRRPSLDNTEEEEHHAELSEAVRQQRRELTRLGIKAGNPFGPNHGAPFEPVNPSPELRTALHAQEEDEAEKKHQRTGDRHHVLHASEHELPKPTEEFAYVHDGAAHFVAVTVMTRPQPPVEPSSMNPNFTTPRQPVDTKDNSDDDAFNAIPIEAPPQVDLDAELRAQRAQLRRVLRPGESPATLHDRAGHSFGPHRRRASREDIVEAEEAEEKHLSELTEALRQQRQELARMGFKAGNPFGPNHGAPFEPVNPSPELRNAMNEDLCVEGHRIHPYYSTSAGQL